jgi:hypothetical protein
MKDKVKSVVAIGVLLFLIVLGLVGYFGWLNIANVDTLHARVDGPMGQVRSATWGRMIECPLEVGDAVVEGEQVALVELPASGSGASAGGSIYVPLRAPLTGVVAAKTAETGQTVSQGQTRLTIVDPEQVWITANIHESRIPQVRVGQRVRIRLRTRTWRRRFWGRVEQVGAATSLALRQGSASSDVSTPSPAEVPVRISIDPGGYPLYPGMTAYVRIRLTPGLWGR